MSLGDKTINLLSSPTITFRDPVSDNNSTTSKNDHHASSLSAPCILCPTTQSSADHPSGDAPRRLLLTGPSHSGKSSLLFEMAYNMASCGISVLYIRVHDGVATTNNNTLETSWMPLECGTLLHCSDQDQYRLMMMDTSETVSANSNKTPQTQSYSSSSILNRIHVHHVVTLRDVYQLLLSWPNRNGPFLIVLDDVDRLLVDRNNSHKSMSQLVSVLIDTANHSDPPASVAVSMTVDSRSTKIHHTALLSPTLHLDCLVLAPFSLSASINSSLQEQYPDMVVASSWIVEGKDKNQSASSSSCFAILRDGMDPSASGKRIIIRLDENTT